MCVVTGDDNTLVAVNGTLAATGEAFFELKYTPAFGARTKEGFKLTPSGGLALRAGEFQASFNEKCFKVCHRVCFARVG